MICGCREVKFLLFAYVNNLLGFLFLFFFFLFQKSNFLAKDCGRVKVGAVIGWLLSHWFNCLFSSQHCLLTSLWPASDCAHCMHANPKRHEPSLALGTAISLISLCLMSETTQSWQVRGKKSLPPPPLPSIASRPGCLLSCQRLWGEGPLLFKQLLLPACCWLSYRDFSYSDENGRMWIGRLAKGGKNKCVKMKTANVAWKIEGGCHGSDTNTILLHLPVSLPISTKFWVTQVWEVCTSKCFPEHVFMMRKCCY